MTFEIIVGDVSEVLPTLEPESFDAVLCDPPYGLSFMGKAWDHGVPSAEVWGQVMPALRPGAHLIAFGGTRTFHRLTCAIEDAGFEIRDCLSWLYGQGFPKSLDVSKAIDRVRYRREQVYRVTAWIREARDRAGLSNREIDAAYRTNGMARHWTDVPPHGKQPAVPTIEQVPKLLDLLGVDPPEEIRRLLWDLNGRKGQPGENWARREKVGARFAGIATPGDDGRHTVGGSKAVEVDITTPATEAAHRFNGYGTALKPAWEPAILAMKPTVGTFARNAVEQGLAGVNVDGCRVGIADGDSSGFWEQARAGRPSNGLLAYREGCQAQGYDRTRKTPTASASVPSGRWPANVLLDPEAAAALDRQSGERVSGSRRAGTYTVAAGGGRFGEFGEGAMPEITGDSGGASRFFYTAKASPRERNAGLDKGENKHPTLKPVRLIEYLAKLLLPPPREDGKPRRLLVPFSGAGSEIAGALRAGWDEAVGIELSEEYAGWARRRVPALVAMEFAEPKRKAAAEAEPTPEVAALGDETAPLPFD